MNDNKNLIVALVLMVGVWFGFNALFPPAPPQTQSPAEPVAAATGGAPAVAAPVDSAPVAEVVAAAPTVAAERKIQVETQTYRAVFSTSGARLVAFELKDYREAADPQSAPVQLFLPGPLRYASLRTTGTESLGLAGDDPYELDSAEERVQIGAGEERRLVFRRVTPSGLVVVKTFVFSGDRYDIDCRLELSNAGSSALRGTLAFALVQRWDKSLKPDSYTFAGPASLVGDSVEEDDVDDLVKEPVSYAKEVAWTSFQTKYFLSAVAPGPQAIERLRIIKNDEAVENIVEAPYLALNPGERQQLDYLLFIGPKDNDQLKAAGHQFDRAVHFGFFDPLAKPLFYVLTFFYGYIKNYGLAIILLTVIIKLLFWPLTHKSYASMKAMQKLQPEMQKVREKFKNDKERLNRELMELYKTHRVNPLGGCLPMLVQIPVFFALYKVLLDSIALRHAPFMFWLTDLSAKDPYYITPLLMGASMFVQQKLTPTATVDPMQAKIFMFLPVVFTFMFLNFPSGLVIYWLVNNLLTIVQQLYIHRVKA